MRDFVECITEEDSIALREMGETLTVLIPLAQTGEISSEGLRIAGAIMRRGADVLEDIGKRMDS